MMNLNIEYNKIAYSDIQNAELLRAIDLAEEKLDTAYAPYSGIHVIAVAILENGEMISCSNQENMAFPSGVCAEVNLLSFIGSNMKGVEINKIVVRGFRKDGVELKNISPCGNCRQVMLETETRQKKKINVVFGSKENGFLVFDSTRDLLPLSFSMD